MTRRRKRSGLSLLEVLVALAIFLMSLIALGTLVSFSADRAQDVQQKGQGIQMCQSKLAEVVSGALPLSSQTDVPFDEDPNWRWSLDAQQGGAAGLWNVTVRVKCSRPGGDDLTVSLSQMVLDPTLRGTNGITFVNPDSNTTSTSNSSATPAPATGTTTPPPASGAMTPSGGGATKPPASGGNTKPPAGGGTKPPSGGGGNPSGGNTKPPGGGTKGGKP
jgi:type II secretory pathway pseudopilin PulG